MDTLFTQHWSVKDFIKFVFPSVMGLITISLYIAVDAMFVSRFVGPMALASVNIIMPFYSLCLGLGIMMASGASALIGIELGERDKKRANSHFSLIFCFLVTVAIIIFLLTHIIGLKEIALGLGASVSLLPYCKAYLKVIIFGITLLPLQLFFEYFIRLDGKPMWAFLISLSSGLINILLDYYFIVHLNMGITGAGIASSAGIGTAVILGCLYFRFRSKNIRPTVPVMDNIFLWKSMVNGSSEMVTEISSAVKILVFNVVIIQYAGENGIAAMAILMNLYFLLSSFHIGLSMGTAPVISYNFGRRNFPKIRQLVRQALTASFCVSILSFLLAKFQRLSLIGLFTDNSEVLDLASNGLAIFAFVFLVDAVNILSSGFFTAVGNGKISALIAFLNTFILTLGFVFVLPHFLELQGVWLSIPMAATIAMGLSVYFFIKYQPVYLGRRRARPTQ